MIELALIVLALGTLVWIVVWASNRSAKAARIEERERAQRKALEDAELANTVRRDITRRDAADRLRGSKWNADNVPYLSANHDTKRRSTDRRDSGADLGT